MERVWNLRRNSRGSFRECDCVSPSLSQTPADSVIGRRSNRRCTSIRWRGFTLVEVLVVVAIIGILFAVLLPAIQAARGSARRTMCTNNLRQLAFAATNYHGIHESFPPGLNQQRFATPPRYRGTSLFTYLLPYLEEGELIRDWDHEFPLRNTDGGLRAPTAHVLPVFLCPSDEIPTNPIDVGGRFYGITSYAGNGGSRSCDPAMATTDGIFHTTGPASEPKPNQQPVSLRMIRDGTSHTVLFGERSHSDANYETFAQMHWTESLRYLGRWAAIGGRRRILDVTLSAWAPINYRLSFDYEQRRTAEPRLASSRDFAFYEDMRLSAFGSEHGGGAMFAFVDGSVRFLSDSLQQSVLQALCTRDAEDTDQAVIRN